MYDFGKNFPIDLLCRLILPIRRGGVGLGAMFDSAVCVERP